MTTPSIDSFQTSDFPLQTSAVGVVVVAAGKSERMGGIDKIFTPLRGQPVLAHSLLTFEQSPLVRRIVVVLSAERLEMGRVVCAGLGLRKLAACCLGGARRQDSVRLGLEALQAAGGCAYVLVHDAARPFVTELIINDGLAAARAHGAAIPVVPVTDTVKQIDERGMVIGTPDRARLGAAQTPQFFAYDVLRAAHDLALAQDISATDDAQMVELLGRPVATFPGDPQNFKLTRPQDFVMASLTGYLDERDEG